MVLLGDVYMSFIYRYRSRQLTLLPVPGAPLPPTIPDKYSEAARECV